MACAAPGCGHELPCDRRLCTVGTDGPGLSDDFCGPSCQAAWHAGRTDGYTPRGVDAADYPSDFNGHPELNEVRRAAQTGEVGPREDRDAQAVDEFADALPERFTVTLWRGSAGTRRVEVTCGQECADVVIATQTFAAGEAVTVHLLQRLALGHYTHTHYPDGSTSPSYVPPARTPRGLPDADPVADTSALVDMLRSRGLQYVPTWWVLDP